MMVIQIYVYIFDYYGMYYWSGCTAMQVLYRNKDILNNVSMYSHPLPLFFIVS